MKKKQVKSKEEVESEESHSFVAPSSSGFYSGGRTEAPLYDFGAKSSGVESSNNTSRHQPLDSGRKQTEDPREKRALVAILKGIITIMLLGISFFVLRKGISLYETHLQIVRDEQILKSTQTLDVAVAIDDLDFKTIASRAQFVDRISDWREADRLVRSADVLLLRDIRGPAIVRCKEALILDPTHIGALQKLADLYFQEEQFAEAVNIDLRLLSIDPSQAAVQEKLVKALDALGDSEAVMYMAAWYQDQNLYNDDMQRYLANAYYVRGEFSEALEAYTTLLSKSPKDKQGLERQADSYMKLEQYKQALVPLEMLRKSNFRGKNYYKQTSICNAQLNDPQTTVQVLSRAAHLFDQNLIIEWIQDPQFDVIRSDRVFQSFTDRVGGAEFRQWLETVSDVGKPDAPVAPKVDEGNLDVDLLKTR